MNNPNDPMDHTTYCDLCTLQPNGQLRWDVNVPPQPATFDAPTPQGPWAYVCKRHERNAYVKMGTKVNTPAPAKEKNNG